MECSYATSPKTIYGIRFNINEAVFEALPITTQNILSGTQHLAALLNESNLDFKWNFSMYTDLMHVKSVDKKLFQQFGRGNLKVGGVMPAQCLPVAHNADSMRLRKRLAEVETDEDSYSDNEDNGPEDDLEQIFSDHESFSEHVTES
ncbi:hypothetical protein AVEN_5612-1 [Araneus ventricosus]|uniref:Uncharacterized protein n=1 Tax=Araneus ventricosus TaxID=182803 RepID=A0A4Y2ML73_ARAVE|nr:hypothetical protein AVEN_5612-1 [Araneus ventricosus]